MIIVIQRGNLMNVLWKQKNWISNPKIDDMLIDKACELEGLEKKLLAETGQDNVEILVSRAMEDEICASSGIEGIRMDSGKIRSSIARNRGWIQSEWSPARQNSDKEARAVRSAIHMMRAGELTHELICECHAMLPQPKEIGWGKYRDHPESVFDENGDSVYDAPDASEMLHCMDDFIKWWHSDRLNLPLAIGSALGHLYFETIHPFHDGNGRIGRMIADKAWEKNGKFRPFSVSGAIAQDKNRYYDFINAAQTQGRVQQWLSYMLKAQESALQTAMDRAAGLKDIQEWVSKTSFQPDSTDLEIIYEMGLANRRRWTEFDATQYMQDGELSEKSWAKLVKYGIIQDGQLDLSAGITGCKAQNCYLANAEQPVEDAHKDEENEVQAHGIHDPQCNTW